MTRTLQAACLAVEAGKVLLVEKERVLAAANRVGIAIVGIGGQTGVD